MDMRPRRSYLLALLPLAVACGSTNDEIAVVERRFPVAVPSDLIVPLPASAMSAALAQCSRDTPSRATNAWAVSPQDLRGLDTLLPPRIERELERRYPAGSPMEALVRDVNKTYGVQAIGVELWGRRLVYLNGFLSSMIRDDADSTAWHRAPVVVCDGGEGFFGALYDPRRGVLSSLDFNGR